MNRKTVFQELRVNQLMKYSFFILFKRRMVLIFLLGFVANSRHKGTIKVYLK